MRKYVNATKLLEAKAVNKEKKPIYATRKLSIGLVSCMLGLVLLAPRSMADENSLQPAEVTTQSEENNQVEPQANDPKLAPVPVPAQNQAKNLANNQPAGEAKVETQSPAPVTVENQPQTQSPAANPAQGAKPAETPAPVSQQGQPAQGTDSKSEISKTPSEEKSSQSSDLKAANTGKEEKSADPAKKPEQKPQQNKEGDKKTEGKTPADKKESEKKKVSIKPEDVLTEEDIYAIRQKTFEQENSYFFNGEMEEKLRSKIVAAIKENPNADLNELKKTLIAEAIAKNTPTQEAPGETKEAKEIDPKLTKPTINNVPIGESTITGNGLAGSGRRNHAKGPCKINVTVNDAEGHEVETKIFTIEKGKNPKKGEPQWSVTLDKPVQKGYTIVAQQELDGKFSNPSETYTVKELLKESYEGKLQMPKLDVWSEDMFVPEADAIEDIINAFKEKNNNLDNVENKNFEGNLYVPKSGDKTKPLSVDWDNKKINVTFSDKSTLEVDFAGKVNLKEITQKSNPAEVENLTIVNNEIKGKISGNGPFKRARVTIVKFNNETSKKNYCESGKCTVDKNATELATILVNETTGEFTYKITDNNLLKLGEDIGITVKEYRKKTNCKTIQPQIKIPKVDVRDPNKLTPTEKAKIIEEIRKANTTAGGVSKLPDGTGDNTGIPAIIQIDDQGNVKIIEGNDVKVKDWDSNGNAIPETNGDGSPIFKEGKGSSVAETKTKEIVTNLPPNPPTVGYDKEIGEISVTPDKADTDAKKITVKYKDPDGNDQEVIITKADGENGKWSAPEGSKVTVNPDTGVVTIKDSDIKNKTDVSAIVTDNGGINTVVENDTKAKDSKNKSETIKVFPKKPEITVDDKTGDVTIKPIDKDGDRVARKMDITYIPAGQTNPKTVTVDRDKDGKLTVTGEPDFKVSEDGKSIIITNDKIKSKSKITALTNDGDADPNQVLKSDESEGNVPDKTAPKPPTVEVNTSDGTAHITPPSDPDVKTIEVKYPGADGNEKTFIAKKTDTGWEISGDDGVTFEMNGYISIPYNKLKKADTITATAKDEDGNESKPGTDISLPPKPDVKLDENKGVITVTPPTDKAPSVDGMEITYTPDGDGASETKLVAKKVGGEWSIENMPAGVTIDKDSGVVTITNDKAKEKSKVIAYSSIDTKKKSLEKGEADVPVGKAPDAPTVKVQEDGSVKITPKNDIETSVTVTYNKADGTPVTVEAKKDGGQWKIENPTNGEEVDLTTGVITIPTGKTNPGDRVKATASKGKKTSKENDDLTKPAPPKVTPNQTSGDVTITPPTKGNVDGMIIKYKKPDDSEGTIKVKKGDGGAWTIEKNPDPEGIEVDGQSGVVKIKKGHAKEKTPVTADSTIETLQTPDKNQGEQPEQVPDKTAPNPPTVIVEENTGNVTITPPKDTDTTKVTVNYKDKDGNDKTAIAKKGDNGWEMEKAENGESVDEKGVITLKKGSYKTGVEVKAYGNDDANNKSDEDNKTPVQVTYEGNGAVSGSMDNKILLMGSEYTLPTCDYTAPANKKFKAWKVGNVEKAPNEIIQINADTKISPVWEDITHDVIFDGNGGSNTMDKKTLPQGSEYNLPENGFTAPEGKEFDGWMVGTEKKSVGDKIKVDKDTEVKAIWKDIEFKVSFDGNSGSGSMGGASVKKGGKYTLPENGFTAPSENQEFKTWEVDGKEMAAGSEITINKNTVVKAVWKNKEKPVEPSKPEPKPNPDQPNPEKPVEPGKPETPEKPVEPGQPETPEKPVEPGKPETPERPVEPGKQENPEKPVETDKPVLDLPSKEKPEEPEKIDTLAPSVSYAKEEDKKEDVDKQIEKTKKTQIKDVSPVKIPRAGDRPNVKTGVESVAGLAVTLVAASGGLFITRKKEDEE